jgi:hypothetical protein
MKIKISENQFHKIKKSLKENSNSFNSKYKVGVNLYFYYSNKNLKFNGLPVENIPDIESSVSFDIDLDYKSWGIKIGGVNNIKGADSIDIEIETNDQIVHNYTLNINWEEKVKIDSNNLENAKIITINEDVNVYLINDNEGNIVVDYIDVETLP